MLYNQIINKLQNTQEAKIRVRILKDYFLEELLPNKKLDWESELLKEDMVKSTIKSALFEERNENVPRFIGIIVSLLGRESIDVSQILDFLTESNPNKVLEFFKSFMNEYMYFSEEFKKSNSFKKGKEYFYQQINGLSLPFVTRGFPGNTQNNMPEYDFCIQLKMRCFLESGRFTFATFYPNRINDNISPNSIVFFTGVIDGLEKENLITEVAIRNRLIFLVLHNLVNSTLLINGQQSLSQLRNIFEIIFNNNSPLVTNLHMSFILGLVTKEGDEVNFTYLRKNTVVSGPTKILFGNQYIMLREKMPQWLLFDKYTLLFDSHSVTNEQRFTGFPTITEDIQFFNRQTTSNINYALSFQCAGRCMKIAWSQIPTENQIPYTVRRNMPVFNICIPDRGNGNCERCRRRLWIHILPVEFSFRLDATEEEMRQTNLLPY